MLFLTPIIFIIKISILQALLQLSKADPLDSEDPLLLPFKIM